MKSTLVLLVCLVIASCNVREKIAKSFDRIKRINSDLVETFRHEDVHTTLGWGTEEEDDRVLVVFSRFNVESTSYRDLETLSSQVVERLLDLNPEFQDLHHIEIRFTKQDYAEDLQQFVTFKHIIQAEL